MMARQNACGRILLADDGSEHAQAAVALLGDLPLPADCQVTVLRVFGSQQASELGLLESAVAQTATRLRDKGLNVATELLLGSPAEVIAEYAEAHKVDLIVVGAKGLRATLGILLGGVAQQVVEYVACPVLVVRTPYNGLNRLLLASDGSAYSQYAAEYLGNFPLPAGVEVRVMHVLSPPPFPVLAPPAQAGGMPVLPLTLPEEVMAMRAEEERQAVRMLEDLVAGLQQRGLQAQPILKRGDAATELIAYIKAEKIDLTVVGSRGLGQARSWLMGSLSRKLVHYSGGSVLVVRGPREN
ncbi:MAG: universal stress protein [Anaerolineales bacterium]